MRNLLLSFVFLILSAPAGAQEFEIKNIHLGKSIGDSKSEFRCYTPRDSLETCTNTRPIMSVGGALITGLTLKLDGEGRVEGYMMTFSADDYPKVKDAVVGKYGVLNCTNSTATNAYGAVMPSENCIKLGEVEVLILNLRGARMNLASIHVSRKDLSDYNKRRAQERGDI